jgi:diketogulonate reductase-like aldo/keto reductase/3-dehydroquinate synthetase
MSSARPPLVGLGTYNDFKDADKVAAAVRAAIREGYRHFDCAALYGNQSEIGKALHEAIKSGDVTREELYVTSKLWCADAAPEDVEAATRHSLEELQLEYLDNLTMHWPVRMVNGSHSVDPATGKHTFQIVHAGERGQIAETYAAMEKLLDLGLVRSLGVSNFDVRLLGELLQDCKVPPVCNQVELHPYLAQRDLLDFCSKMDISVVAYTPLGRGATAKGSDEPDLLGDHVIMQIAHETGMTPAQILLRWGVQRGTSVIPKTLDPERVLTNRDVLDWALTPSQMERIDSLDCGHRYIRVPWFDFDVKPPSNVNTPPPGQALIKEGNVDEHGFYRNSFARDGRELRTEVLVRRGLLEPDELARNGRHLLPEKCWGSPVHLITDEAVDALYGAQVVEGLSAAGFTVHKAVMRSDRDESGETSTEHFKTIDSLMEMADLILERGITKHSAIVSLGGGVVNNLAGVLAGMLYRGISLVHFPTTTMSAFDAALDFKQAVNHTLGKNLLGTYYPASTIAIDPDVLATLSERHSLNGVAEALKHGLTQSLELTDMIVRPLREGDQHEVIKDGGYMERLCKAALEIKAPTLDDYDRSDFNEYCPQYGHCIGHSVEHLSWSGKAHQPLLHGEAVAIGMAVSAEVALIKGVCTQEVVDEHYDLIGATGLPTFVPRSMDIKPLIRQMRFDKHTVKNPTMGLCAAIGGMAMAPGATSYAFDVTEEELVGALEANFARRDSGTVCGSCASVFAAKVELEEQPASTTEEAAAEPAGATDVTAVPWLMGALNKELQQFQ